MWQPHVHHVVHNTADNGFGHAVLILTNEKENKVMAFD